MKKTFPRTRLFLASTLALAAPYALAQTGISPQFDSDYALLPKDALARGAAGATLVHDYGVFALWRVDAAQRARIAAGNLREVASLADRSIALPAGAFIPGAADAQPAAASGTNVYVVQFVGPMTDAWLAKIRATGATPLQYVNNNAYLVLADAGAGRQRNAAIGQRRDLAQIAGRDARTLRGVDAP